MRRALPSPSRAGAAPGSAAPRLLHGLLGIAVSRGEIGACAVTLAAPARFSRGLWGTRVRRRGVRRRGVRWVSFQTAGPLAAGPGRV